jgi:hypothetical protein
VDLAYWAAAVALSLVTKLLDQLGNGPLPAGAPWPGSIDAARSHWLRFALAYALAATAGLWIGVQSGSVRAVWISAIVLVFMLPDIRLTYRRVVWVLTPSSARRTSCSPASSCSWLLFSPRNSRASGCSAG